MHQTKSFERKVSDVVQPIIHPNFVTYKHLQHVALLLVQCTYLKNSFELVSTCDTNILYLYLDRSWREREGVLLRHLGHEACTSRYTNTDSSLSVQLKLCRYFLEICLSRLVRHWPYQVPCAHWLVRPVPGQVGVRHLARVWLILSDPTNICILSVLKIIEIYIIPFLIKI